ncbi:FkbM family methyltransferase [Ferrovibrio xuzhouensis]|uniref:FkbM family methyltransferase n=1 Tax=Ferrovibrio xuzhouensis TaxID=1576914 RepID=A0ABV7VET4_9PROT
MSAAFEKVKAAAEAYERSIPAVTVPIRDKSFSMVVPNLKCLGFALTAATREPATNAWIYGFRPGEVFFDVGANNGLYGLIAAVVAGCEVHAFEPHFASYYVLTRNIFVNKLQDRMFSYPIAVADTESCGKMFLSSITAGKSLNNFGDARPSDDPLWNATIPQGSVSMSLDRFSEQTGIVPHHIKIDVDGIEPLIIAGAAKLLANPKLVSVMVETMEQLESHRPIHQHMLDAGFTRFVKDPAGIFYFRS